MSLAPKYLVWLDLETTGLDPVTDEILEVGIQIVPFDSPFRSEPFAVGDISPRSWVIEKKDWTHVSPFILDMHGKNGLIADCVRSTTALVDVTEALLNEFRPLCDLSLPKDDQVKLVLAGSSVHFDHAFLSAKMPTVAKYLSHRHYDVSALKLVCLSQGMPYVKGEPAHRVLDDIEASKRQAQECLDWMRRYYKVDLGV